MPLLGAHMSIAGGHWRALQAAADMDMQACQLFSKSNQQWRAAPLVAEEVERFHSLRREKQIQAAVAHASYLINLAAPDPGLWAKSCAAFLEEVQRAECLGLDGLVFHPGTPTDGDLEAGMDRIAQAVSGALKATAGSRVQLLLETTAGQGRSLGHTFGELAAILARITPRDRVGVCLDTCHVFAAGYGMSPRKEYLQTFRSFEKLIGLERLRVFHLNDSKKPRGSRLDRHEHIGKGHLGLEPFQFLLRDKRFKDLPMILETPKEWEDGSPADPVNLETLRKLLR